MSYEIISSISEKQKTVTCASNNVYPHIYSKCSYKQDLTVDQFRASVIEDLLFGNFHYSNKNHIYNIVASKVRATEEFKDLDDKIWNFDNHYTDEWRHEHYQENINALHALIVKTFNEVKAAGKESWVLRTCYCYLAKLNRRTYRTCSTVENAKIFGSKELAESSRYGLGNGWFAEKIN